MNGKECEGVWWMRMPVRESATEEGGADEQKEKGSCL
jgi:hypothetical protein